MNTRAMVPSPAGASHPPPSGQGRLSTGVRRAPAHWRAAFAVVLALVGVFAGGEWAARQELDNQWDNLRRSGEVQVLALRGVATRYSYLPHTVALHPLLAALLRQPRSPAVRAEANAYLEGVNRRAGSDALYVMAPDGTTLAASNWATPRSFVDQNYGNRPYFQDALAGRSGRFYGVGKTTGEPGLFVSAPVREGQQVIGVVAVKVSLQPIVDTWNQLRDPVVLLDERGIAFLGSIPAWLYKTSRPLSEAETRAVQTVDQYGPQWRPQALPWQSDRLEGEPGVEIQVLEGQRYLALHEALPDLDWTLVAMADRRAVDAARHRAWVLLSLAAAVLVLGTLYWGLREQRLRETRQARFDLERRVQERTHELQQAHAFRQSMEDSLLVGMRARDLDGRIIYVNAGFCDMVGYRADELVGRLPPYPYWHPDDLDKHWEDSDTALAGKAATTGFESRLRHRDGRDVVTMVYTARLVDGGGNHVGWMSSVVDITEQKKAEELQRQRDAQLQRVQRVVTVGEMASTLAHELNQPLGALVNYAAAARSFAAQHRYELMDESLAALSAQAQRASDFIGRIRQWVRQHPAQWETLDLNDVVAQSLALLLRAEARRLGIPVRIEAAGSPARILGDRVLLEQVVINLGNNALQAMQGAALPSAELALCVNIDNDQVRLQVLDRGPGLPEQDTDRIFEPFYTTREHGLGLGLNICRTIVESMGGHLVAGNREGGGAVFIMTLPLWSEEAPT